MDLAAHYLREAGFCTVRAVAEARAAALARERGGGGGGEGGADTHVAVGAARRLVDLALKLGSSDNITAVVVLLEEAGGP